MAISKFKASGLHMYIGSVSSLMTYLLFERKVVNSTLVPCAISSKITDKRLIKLLNLPTVQVD